MSASPFSLAGKVALVTGGASGIGAGIVEMLARAGALVVVADRDEAGARARAEALAGAGRRADAIGMDVADEASVAAACGEIVRRHGAPWALVNNAGIQDRQYLLDETVEALGPHPGGERPRGLSRHPRDRPRHGGRGRRRADR